MTELKTFVSETIQQIIEGAKEAGVQLKESIDYERDGYFQIGDGMMEKIEFDISVETTEASKTEGKAGIMIKVVDFGVKGTDNTEATSVNKIRFSVPVGFVKVANKEFN
ncbi:MAG: trypco2 family protein [Cyclobacteriaceae bacterium]